ncbi:restriction endonuclease [Pseudonocardia sp. KRD-184]|uniref:Restriction endonuclease n=1 Tax=Pseudonocardia oceani TaxID=2792013 RepID=A0ABS6U8M6_9PSEU|nr:restriction endonuclease [Pseudonocardia oceani]MBW0093808.1 restriction endonuclease [Pseudonocardia oceani]MBW0095955.1 restriction endonuclease [Pseudonocardia oceani]MBW0108632.1 restriction endonuclease [Pseudonocardia oceani]MBW0122760.1 restriction endonuclease [Pseudonocardia oceani]MBW0128602.1 restriction endonuclease [Pseudonocardia oceani]
MAVWLVRCGKRGEGGEAVALENGLVGIGWGELGDLASAASLDDVRARLATTYKDDKPGTLENWARQINTFLNWIKPGDLVAMPLKETPAVAFGTVTGGYSFAPDAIEPLVHQRTVKWLREDVPRQAIGQDLLYSLGAFMTVCQIKRNDAEDRFNALLQTGTDPGLHDGNEDLAEEDDASVGGRNLTLDVEDQVRAMIGSRFHGHALARLVDEVLRVEGYSTDRSPAGPDGGVDILAGRGPMGFDGRLAVQVKSGNSVCDAPTLRELQGVMANFGATHGLLVSWGGFTKVARQEARRLFFQIRLWDSQQLINRIQEIYTKLPEGLRAEMPMKQIWTVATDD